MINAVAEQYGFEKDAEMLLAQKRVLFRALLPSKVKLMNGVEAGLEKLAHFPKAIVTMSNQQDALAIVANTVLHKYFDVIVSSTDVTNFKPDPECYLLGEQKIGFAASEPIALEDSVSGILAAKNAGCFTIALGNSLAKEMLPEADVFCDTTKDALKKCWPNVASH